MLFADGPAADAATEHAGRVRRWGMFRTDAPVVDAATIEMDHYRAAKTMGSNWCSTASVKTELE